jgi:hypothetical protein
MHRAGAILPVATVLGGLALAPTLARAEPPPPAAFMSDEDEQEDRIDDGDIDEEDRVALRIGGQPGAADVHGQSWLSVEGFGRQLWSGKNDVGAGLVLALALDRVAQGPVHKVSDPSPAIPETPAESTKVTFPSSLARDCVVAAWRGAGLGIDDARIDAIISRSRTSALLPEMRLRAMRLFTDAAHTTLLATTDATNYYDAVGANLVLEARLTWRLDRLVYAGDEATLERVRLERHLAPGRSRPFSRGSAHRSTSKRRKMRARVPGRGAKLRCEPPKPQPPSTS